MSGDPIHVAVCGPGTATSEEEAIAEEVGRRLAMAGAVVVCGGMGGVMDAAARGATGAGGARWASSPARIAPGPAAT